MSGVSVATIKSPEFINITSISPLISKCEIKVLYVGQNRNRSFISKEVAAEMAKTLPGTPIVGYYSDKEEDFRDHGDQMVIDGDGIKFNCLTKPYGFVSTDTKVWFKEFEDTDDFGNKILREYLMCEGYLWTEQYKEAQAIINEGRPHSMELDEKTLKGHWSTDNNSGLEFFIINDAIFSKLCILGENVEPCFEGSAVTAPDVSSTFTKNNDEFVKSLFTMMKELKEYTYSLKNGGENSMEDNKDIEVQATEEPVTEEFTASENSEENIENFSNSQDNSNSEVINENQDNIEEYKKNDDEEKNDESDDSDSKTEDETGSGEDEEDEDKKKAAKNTLEQDYSLLQTELEELKNKYSILEEENKKLVEFKNAVEDEKKDTLINSFYMLSDEDKKDVVENKSKYSLDEIEAKLSVICVRKKVNFNLDTEESNGEEQPAITYNLNTAEADDLPAWLKAVESHKA